MLGARAEAYRDPWKGEIILLNERMNVNLGPAEWEGVGSTEGEEEEEQRM